MNVVEETRALREELAALAAKPEWDVLARYDLLREKPPQALHERVWRSARRVFAAAGLMPPHVTNYPWQPALKHAPAAEDARTLLIWALNVEREALRRSCEAIAKRLQAGPAFAPVLVTDVADFAYYSRLAWFVEYLPELSGEGPSYRERKRRHLAWRYRDAVSVPVSAGLADEAAWQEVLGTSRT